MAFRVARCFLSQLRYAGCNDVKKRAWENRFSCTLSLKTSIVNRIRHCGPLTIYEFMKECLTNPTQIIGVWLLHHWKMTIGSRFQLVELGPGRGTLVTDILRKDEKGDWREVLVDVIQQKVEELRLVLSPTTTAAQIAYLRSIKGILNDRSCVEISPRTLVYINEVCQRLECDGGAALLVDYGHLGEKGDTLRAFKDHRICDILSEPGETDVTYDVDFSQLSHQISSSGFKVDVHGPECQAYFLINMGLLTRLEKLLSNCRSESQQDELLSGCEMLITDEQMGSRFKVMAILPQDHEKRPVPGFFDLPGTPYFNQPGAT